MLPRVLCVYWGFHSWCCLRQRGGFHGLLNLAISLERMPLMHGCHRPPPGMPNPGMDPTTFRLQDLLSGPGILVYVHVCVHVCANCQLPYHRGIFSRNQFMLATVLCWHCLGMHMHVGHQAVRLSGSG